MAPFQGDGERDAEVKKMHYLLKVSRKRQIGKPVKVSAAAMSHMDVLETVPMMMDDIDGYPLEPQAYPESPIFSTFQMLLS